MQIKVLDSVLDYGPAIKGWYNSRTEQADVTYLYSVDAPVNEFPTALLEFVGMTIIEREIFTSARNHVVWARTSRVDDPTQFTVPHEFENKEYYHNQRSVMRTNRDSGMSQDQWRLALPLVSHTSWTARMSFRDIIKMGRYFSYLAYHQRIQKDLRPRFLMVADRLQDVIEKFMRSTAKAHNAFHGMKLVKFLNEQNIDNVNFATTHFRAVTAIIPIALRAQLVRHREIHFVDDFFALLCCKEVTTLLLRHTVRLQAIARTDVWNAIIGKRGCWIAQADLWEPVVSRFEGATLPCADGNCPYEVDASARLVAGADPNPPCPRYCNLKGIDKSQYVQRMRDEATKRGMKEFWEREITQ